MCFYRDDYDWLARVFEVSTVTAPESKTCRECFETIAPGVPFTHIDMQEYEECRRCQEDRCDDRFVEGSDCDAEGTTHDFGETDTHRRCQQCEKFLEAIQRVEEDDGCSGPETQPGLGELREAMWESDHAVEYIDRARVEYPELAMSGYLDRMYRHTHEWDREFEERWDEDDVGPTDEMGGEG